MRIVFMGTPDFAVPSLRALYDAGHDIAAVYSQPDKPRGRGHKLQPTPVKELALELGVDVRQPVQLRDQEVKEEIRDLKPDIIVVVAYGKILPKDILEIPAFGCVNAHGSLLPKYRGAAPIQWAVINGDKVTGVTTMYMAEGMDTGDILLQKETEIMAQETSGELFDRLKIMSAELLVETLSGIERGDIKRTPQEDSKASMAPMLTKQDGEINWRLPAETIHSHIRGMNPWPSAFTGFRDGKIKIYSSRVIEGKDKAPGELWLDDDYLAVGCGEGALRIMELQAENGKCMDSKSFLLGHKLNDDEYFSPTDRAERAARV